MAVGPECDAWGEVLALSGRDSVHLRSPPSVLSGSEWCVTVRSWSSRALLSCVQVTGKGFLRRFHSLGVPLISVNSLDVQGDPMDHVLGDSSSSLSGLEPGLHPRVSIVEIRNGIARMYQSIE